MAGKKRGPKTKEEKMDEIEALAKEYVEEKKAEEEKAPMVLVPPRGYFRKLDQGLWVENLQRGLNQLCDANVAVTGEYDDDTMLAVTQFETKYGGCANGMFDGRDLESYNKLRGVE